MKRGEGDLNNPCKESGVIFRQPWQPLGEMEQPLSTRVQLVNLENTDNTITKAYIKLDSN